jgi:intergrase/recombinase
VSDIQRESQAVLDSIKENYFHVLWTRGKNDGFAVYVPKEAIFKEMAAKIEYVKPAFIF